MYAIARWSLALCLLPLGAWAQEKSLEDYFPPEPDPIMGEYVGQWDRGEDVDVQAAAQVIALGNDMYRVVFRAKLDMRSPVKFTAEGKAVDGVLEFSADRHKGRIENGVMTGGRGRMAAFTLKKVAREIPNLGTPAPEGATVLFDGSNLDAWRETKGWEITPDGALLVTPAGEYLVSKEEYGDLKLHVEFRLPYMPTAVGQGRGNSGVFMMHDYEVQVLDSFGLEGYYDDCGAIYKVSAPKVNACRPPLDWQAYDITFRAARFDAEGKVTENPRITVVHNGVLIHDNQECWWITGWKDDDRAKPHPQGRGPVKLQGHNNFVQFRNIWVQPLD